MICRVTGWVGALLLASSIGFANERPNVLVLLADDLGHGDLGVTGHPHIETPHLDALAGEGAIFTNFYSPAQVCSPSRAAMLTGRMAHRLGIYSFIGGSSGDLVHLPETEVTLPQLLRQSGYQTAHIGKWHNSLNRVQAKNNQIPTMNHYGFDYWVSSDDNAANINKPGWIRNGKPEGVIQGYTADTVGREAVLWLKEFRKPDRPFIQFVHFYEPHWYVEAPDEIVDGYVTNGVGNRDEATYFGAVSNVDRAVGKILAALDRLSLKENTVVFFSSDHGPARLGAAGSKKRNYGLSEPYRGHKYGLWEGSIHVPGIVRWPARVKAGSVIEEPAGSIDWLPTIVEMTGTPLPEDLDLDGQSHLPLLLGQGMERRKPLQWHHYNTNSQHSPNPNAVMREGDYVICGFYAPETKLGRASWKSEHLERVQAGKLVRFALFDVEKDPKQQLDLSKTEPELFQRLSKELEIAHRRMQKQAMGWDGVSPVHSLAELEALKTDEG